MINTLFSILATAVIILLGLVFLGMIIYTIIGSWNWFRDR